MNKYQVILSGIALAMIFMVSCMGDGDNNKAQNNTATDGSAANPIISFDKTVHDFGRIITGERVAYAFRFKNTGESPLIISGIRSGCGCTVGDYPKDPVKPGEEGKISVVFNSAGRRGFQSETIRVLNNSEESVVTLRITAEALEQ